MMMNLVEPSQSKAAANNTEPVKNNNTEQQEQSTKKKRTNAAPHIKIITCGNKSSATQHEQSVW